MSRALAEVPKFVYHKIRIHIDYGDYTGKRGPDLFHINQTADSRKGLKLLGHTENNDYYDSERSVEDIVFTGGLDSGCIGSEELEVVGITIDGVWQSYDSSIRIRNCVFRNGHDFGNDDVKSRLVGGHRTRAEFFGCTFKDSEMIASVSPLAYTSFERCTAENITDFAFELYASSIVFLDESPELITVPPNDSINDASSRIVNHPDGLIQLTSGRPKSRGRHTFGDGIRLNADREEWADEDLNEVTDEPSKEDVVLRNVDGDLVGFDGGGNRLGKVQFGE
jgi:hypothetical protein